LTINLHFRFPGNKRIFIPKQKQSPPRVTWPALFPRWT
jgi:hypothetical protein